MTTLVNVVGIAATVAAALLWLRASSVDVPDNMDTFIGELKRAARWNAWAAFAACIAAACVAVDWVERVTR